MTPSIDILKRWASLQTLMKKKGLGWAFHKLDKKLRVARTPEFYKGVVVSHLLPKDYIKFVNRFGYPVIGFSYYCRVGMTFLPPEYMQALSPLVFDRNGNELTPLIESPTQAQYAFFSGQDLAHVRGVAFGRSKNGKISVWSVDGTVQVELRSFSEWLNIKIDEITDYITSLSKDEIVQLKINDTSEGDPHRALDYAVYDKNNFAFSKKDLSVYWVEDQSTSPYTYGVVDNKGRWLMPLKNQFFEIAPFRHGRARVETNDGKIIINYSGKKFRSVPSKKVIRKNEFDSKGKKFGIIGSISDHIGWGQLEEHITSVGGSFTSEVTSSLDYLICGNLDNTRSHFPDQIEKMDKAKNENPRLVVIDLPEFLKKSGFVP